MAKCGSYPSWRYPITNFHGLLRFMGNIEHLIIEIDFMGQLWRAPHVEYTIPQASTEPGSTRDGYADLTSQFPLRMIWDVKPKSLLVKGKDGQAIAFATAMHYVEHANLKCGGGWIPGVHYQTRHLYSREDCVFSFVYDRERYDLIVAQPLPGAVIYHWEDSKRRELARSEVGEAFRKKMYEVIFGSSIPALEPRKNGRKAPKPVIVPKPEKTPEIVRAAADLGVTYEELPNISYMLPGMGVPVLEQCIDELRDFRGEIETFMREVAVQRLFDGERVAVLLDETVYQRLIMGQKTQSIEERLKVRPPTIIADSPSQIWGKPVLTPVVKEIQRLLEQFRVWWNGLSPTARTIVIVGVVAVAAGGIAFLFGEAIAAFVAAGIVTAAALAGKALAAVASVKTLVVVGGVLVMVLTLEGKASASLPELPGKENPAAKQIGASLSRSLSPFQCIPAKTPIVAIGVPRIGANGIQSIETVTPQFEIITGGVSLRGTREVEGVLYRVVGLSK